MGASFSKNNSSPPPPKKVVPKWIPVRVRVLGTLREITFHVKNTDTIKSFRHTLSSELSIPIEKINILHSGEPHKDDAILAAEYIKNGPLSLSLGRGQKSVDIMAKLEAIAQENNPYREISQTATVMADEKKQVTNMAGSIISGSEVKLNNTIEKLKSYLGLEEPGIVTEAVTEVFECIVDVRSKLRTTPGAGDFAERYEILGRRMSALEKNLGPYKQDNHVPEFKDTARDTLFAAVNLALEQDAAITKRHQEVKVLTSQGFLSKPRASSSAVTPPSDSTHPASAGPTPPSGIKGI